MAYANNHIYAIGGNDANGSALASVEMSESVTVEDVLPTAAFIWSPDSQDEGSPVQFTDQSVSNPDITTWIGISLG